MVKKKYLACIFHPQEASSDLRAIFTPESADVTFIVDSADAVGAFLFCFDSHTINYIRQHEGCFNGFVPVDVVADRGDETIAILPKHASRGNTLVCLPSRLFHDEPQDFAVFMSPAAVQRCDFS